MKWIPQDIDMFLQSKEYVDTAVVPLLPVSLNNEMKQTASMCEFISLLSVQIERQFKGRILMLPGFAYFKSTAMEKLQGDVKVWESELYDSGFKHVFYVTSDSIWKSLEGQLNGNLIWLPSLPLDQMDERNRNAILEDQVKQLLHLFLQSWKISE